MDIVPSETNETAQYPLIDTWHNRDGSFKVEFRLIWPTLLYTTTYGNARKEEITRMFDDIEAIFAQMRNDFSDQKIYHILHIKKDRDLPIAFRSYALKRVTTIFKQNIVTRSVLISDTVWSRMMAILANNLVSQSQIRIAKNLDQAIDFVKQAENLNFTEDQYIDRYKHLSKEDLLNILTARDQLHHQSMDHLIRRISTLTWEQPPHFEAVKNNDPKFKAVLNALELAEKDIEQYKGLMSESQIQQTHYIRIKEEQNKRSDEHLRLIMDGSDQSILLVDTDYRLLDFNQKFKDSVYHFTGITLKQGMHVFNIAQNEKRSKIWKNRLESAFQGISSTYLEDFEFEGHSIHFKVKYQPVLFNNRADLVIIFQQDITENVVRERSLLEQNTFIDGLVNTLPGLIYIYDLESESTIYLSKSIQTVFNAPLNVDHLSFEDLIESEDKDRLNYSRRNYIGHDKNGSEYKLRLGPPELLHKEWVMLKERPYEYKEDGTIKAFIGFAYNFESIQASENQLKDILQQEKLISRVSAKLIGINLENFESIFADIISDLRMEGILDSTALLLWGSSGRSNTQISWDKGKSSNLFSIKYKKKEIFNIDKIKNEIQKSDYTEIDKVFDYLLDFYRSHPNETPFNINSGGILLTIKNKGTVVGAHLILEIEGKKWSETQKQTIRILSDIFSTTLEKLKFEQEALKQQSELSSILENTADNIWSVDTRFRILTSNSTFINSFKASYGYSIEPGVVIKNLVIDGHWSFFEDKFKRAFNGEKLIEEWTYDGQVYELSFHPLVEAGRIKGCTVFSRNITYRNIYEGKLLQSENMMSAIINNTDDLIWLLDTDLRLVKYNHKFAESSKNNLEIELESGMQLFEIIPQEYQAEWREIYNQAKRGIKVLKELGINDQYFLVNANPVFEQGEVKYIGVFMKNISDRKAVENTIMTQNEELLKVNKELDSFVYKASHDLRAPLVSVLGLINISKIETDESRKQEYLSLQEKSIKKLDKYIQDIIDYSRNARQDIHAELVNLEEILETVLDQNKYILEEGRLQLKKNIDLQEPLISDRRRLEVVLNNLVSNAIRYHDPSKPSLILHITLVKTAIGHQLRVEDNGIGIAPEHQDKVFEMFYRATSSRAGSGLGLYIVKESVSKLGGNITLDSTPGVGTTFCIELPKLPFTINGN